DINGFTSEELAQRAYDKCLEQGGVCTNECMATKAETCTGENGELLTKYGNDYLTAPEFAFAQCKDAGNTTCTNANGEEVRKMQGEYLTKAERKDLIETSTKDFYDMMNNAIVASEAVNGDKSTWWDNNVACETDAFSEACLRPFFDKYWKDYIDY
ncbi:hypothetical protein IJV79_02005, partial [bacterium]|nr:hypothetical protein [bacterium]